MIRSLLRRAAGAAAVAAAAAPALADPAISEITWTPDRGRRVEVVVRAAVANGGSLKVAGTVNGRRVRASKRLRSGASTARVRIDAKKARIRGLDGPLVFDLDASVRERGGATPAVRSWQGVLPVPVLVLGGLGNESAPTGMDAFAVALDLASGGAYRVGAVDAALTVHTYPSLDAPLAELGAGLDAAAREALRGTLFRKVDVVGYSLGGVVARQWMADGGGDRVRTLVLLASPNQGLPLAFVAGQLLEPASFFSGVLGDLPADPQTLLGLFAPGADAGTFRNLYPSYTWLSAGGFPAPLGPPFFPDAVGPITELNGTAPPAGVTIHSFFYTSVLPEAVEGLLAEIPGLDLPEIGTLDTVDIDPRLFFGQGTPPDLADLFSGDGDLVVPARSARMDDVPSWRDAMTAHDLGAGTHFTIVVDPRVAAEVASILARTE